MSGRSSAKATTSAKPRSEEPSEAAAASDSTAGLVWPADLGGNTLGQQDKQLKSRPQNLHSGAGAKGSDDTPQAHLNLTDLPCLLFELVLL